MESQQRKKEFIPWPDLIRVVATLLVVMVHVSGQITNVWGQVPVRDWLIANVYGGIARVCVALFFMISGYLLLPRQETLGAFYRKRMPKVLIPFVVWSLIYAGWFCKDHACTPQIVWNLFFVWGAYYHLWFLYSLIGIYLILPVLRLMTRTGADQRILWYLFGLWLIFQPGLSIAKQFWGFNTKLGAPLTTGFIGCFILGYLLGDWILSRRVVIVSAAAWLLGTLVTILGTYWMTSQSGKFEGFFYDLISLNVIVASAGAFLVLRWIGETKLSASSKIRDTTRSLATASFGIYLVHVLVIEILGSWIPGFHFDTFIGNPLWSIPLLVGIVFILSFLIVRLLQKVPLLNLIVPS